MINNNIRFFSFFIFFSIFLYGSDKNFTVLENPNSNTIKFSIDELNIEKVDNLYKIGVDTKSKTIEVGKPELPIYSFSYGLDPEKEYSIEYKVTKTSVIDDIEVFPYQPDGENLNKELIKDYDIYENLKSYPESNISQAVVSMRGYEIMNVQILPFEYLPKTKKLIVHDEVEISIVQDGYKQNGNFSAINKKSRVFENFYNNLVLHSDFQREGDYQQPSIIYICGDGAINSSGMQLLVEWRKKQGYAVDIVEIDQIGSSTTSIKNYIENAYDNWENPPEFVGLVGDSGGPISLPAYTVGSGGGWGGAYAESDYPYTLMDGPSDIIGDIFVGRLSVRSTSDVYTVANKIIGYEQAYAGFDWIENAALVGDPYDSGISTVITNQYIEQIMANYGVQNINTKYSGSGFDTFMRDEINNGISYLNYRGFYGFSNFNSNDVDALYNGYKLPFIVTLTCDTGSFQTEATCIIEDLFRAGSANNPKGGVAVVGTAQPYTHTAFNNIVAMGIFEGIFVQGAQTTGEALLYGKYAINNTYPQNPNNNAYYFSAWNNLMGDPATLLWTKRPLELIVDHNQVISESSDNFVINVMDENGNPVFDANVNLYHRNDLNVEIYKNCYTDEFGYCTVPVLDFSSNNNIEVTVSKQDYLFSSSSFMISSASSDLSIDLSSLSILDSTSGNGDGMANPGETIALDFIIDNSSDISFNNVTVSLSSPSSLINLDESVVVIDEISSNSQFSLGESLSFSIPSSVSIFNEPYLFLEMSYINENGDIVIWIDNLNLDIFSGSSDVSPVVMNDTNNNSILERGESASLSFNLHNIGEILFSDLTGTISYNGTLLDFSEIEIFWNQVDVGNVSLSSNSIQVSVDNNVINGTILNIPIEITSSNGNYSSIVYFDLQIGEATVNDPLGPDSYGYYIYDESDTDYELAPEYDWIEIDPYYGGLGQEVDVYDGGNNGDESTVVELPFTFTFYGTDYNEITICSNGWISFGDTDLASFRNYPIPGPGGPSPMLAVFWDDLTMSAGGEIFTLYDQDSDSFIIEWSGMRTYSGNGLETFQAILINSNWESPTGDDDIKLQYKEFNNVSEGQYPVGNYDGAVVHGQYCSIGIENNDGTGGLEYTYNNNYPIQCMPMSDQRALFITTKGASLYAQPELLISNELLTYDIELNQSASQDLILENIGEDGSILSYEINISPFGNPQSYVDEFGYTWSESRVDEYISSEWIDISQNNIVLEYETNDDALLYDLEFNFPFYNQNYSNILINPNGWIGLGEDSNAWNNQPLFSDDAPNNAIFGFWDDLCPINESNSDGEGYVRVNSNQERIVIWYDNVRHWTSYDRIYNFQIVLYSTGEIHFHYGDMNGEVDSATIGIINSDGDIGHEVVYNSEFIEDDITLHFRQSPDWLSAFNTNATSDGIVEANNSEIIEVIVDMFDNPIGSYLSYILIDTNTSYDPIIPITVNVVDDFLYGDLNSDGSVDVLDAVRMIQIIINEDEVPTSHELLVGDLNQDGLIDVLDIVILINIIINE